MTGKSLANKLQNRILEPVGDIMPATAINYTVCDLINATMFEVFFKELPDSQRHWNPQKQSRCPVRPSSQQSGTATCVGTRVTQSLFHPQWLWKPLVDYFCCHHLWKHQWRVTGGAEWETIKKARSLAKYMWSTLVYPFRILTTATFYKMNFKLVVGLVIVVMATNWFPKGWVCNTISLWETITTTTFHCKAVAAVAQWESTNLQKHHGLIKCNRSSYQVPISFCS